MTRTYMTYEEAFRAMMLLQELKRGSKYEIRSRVDGQYDLVEVA